MPSFFTRIFSRVRVAENKFTGPINKLEYCPPGDMATRVHLVPLAQASAPKTIRLRTGTSTLEMVADVGIWEAFDNSVGHHCRQPSTLGLPAGQQRSVSISSTATAFSAGSCDSGDTLLPEVPEVSDDYACRKGLVKAKNMDDLLADIDQAALFDELEALSKSALYQTLVTDSMIFNSC
ncbi:hypothetical protein BDY19DRAFT_938470 [Irpex rosettiformis]|uniref:Uncharacterized protein n=1 Tax=Irpex rosettiformis TaxID=378272 RepID=A0ACB8U6Y9_9APHY|nr:hypothetical protein BDY19DRAFT_938470 [Irpex rosettiformis]